MVKMFKDKYTKKAHEITQNYIESFGAQFANIDDLDNAIASALHEVAQGDYEQQFLDLSVQEDGKAVLRFESVLGRWFAPGEITLLRKFYNWLKQELVE